MPIVTIGLDLAKHVFQVHGVDEAGKVVLRRQLRRNGIADFFHSLPPCLVGMEACASAHYWARRLVAMGHEVRLISPNRVKAYIQRGKKNDANDAAAIAEAVTRPHMDFVPVKNEDQQAVLMLHRARHMLVRQRTMLINALRSHLAEFGIIAAQGVSKAKDLIAGLDEAPIPELARTALRQIAGQIDDCHRRILDLEKRIVVWHRSNEASSNLATIPGIGPITASALAASVVDPAAFKSGPAPGSLAGPRAPPELHRRQGPARTHHENRRQLHSSAAGPRRHQRHPSRPGQGTGGWRVVEGTAGPQIPPPHIGGTCQQDGPYRLGRPGARGGFQGNLSRSECGLTKERLSKGWVCNVQG